MKTIYTLIISLILTTSIIAQAPNKFSYQAVIRNNSDQLVANKDVGMRIGIVQGTIYGASIYVETHSPTTNANGLISIEIGSGTVTHGDFSTIDWNSGPYFVKTETDPDGGTNYSITGINQLLSVPYALHAKTADEVSPIATENIQLNNHWLSGDGDDEGMFINENGNVGVMLDNPIDPLHTLGAIFSSGPNSGLKFSDRTGDETDNWIWYAKDGAAHLHRWQLGQNYVSVKDNGNVGLGYTNPNHKLHVRGNAMFKGVDGYSKKGDAGIVYLGDVNHSIRAEFGYGIKIKTHSVANALNIKEGTGYIGIGTENPKGRLHVTHNVALGNDVPGQMFVIHSRSHAQGEFMHITCDNGEGGWDWTKGITLNRNGKFEVRGELSVNNNPITNVSTPVNDHDAATKAYVDKLLRKIERLEALVGVEDPVVDQDGNQYMTIRIGEQVWMAENLKTTKYSDGSAIPLVTDNASWSHRTSPAYCWYNNDANTYKDTYGAMYNWYTVNTGKLCPTGWHVPTGAEWNALYTALGGYLVAGGKLKETGTSHWQSPNTGATNESNFTGLPGGIRSYSAGTFDYVGQFGNWWRRDQSSSTNCIVQRLSYGYAKVIFSDSSKSTGYSVRCVKD